MSRYSGGGGPGRGGPPGRGGDRDRPGDRGGPAPQEKSLTDIWPNYLDGGYFDNEGCLKIEYVSRENVKPLVEEMRRARDKLTTHQIRRYFGHCRALETRLKADPSSWARLYPQVKKLDIAAADAVAKQPPKVPRIFHDFIQRNVDKIRSEKDFLEGFLPHFEAVVGFGQAYFDKGRN